ncbi:exophilin-5 [Rhinoderma darwinii]|uniref:exophilin-5 n=1 Tax=Rhinoderma darwinii TaxID=43563 RepID=UPI003F681BBD
MSSLLPETESSRMTTSRNFQSQKNAGPSFLGLRSPLSSLFSFRKSAKQNLKLPTQQERHGIFSISGQIPPNTEVKKKFEIYHSARSVKQIASFFEAQHNHARENDSTKATTQLEKEVIQVLGDLDQKLDQEQSHNQTLRTSRLASHKHGRQYSKEGSLHNPSEPKKVYSSLPSHDGRTVPIGETHTTHATYQPKKFNQMYSNRQRPVSKPETSLFSSVSNTSPSLSSCSGSFSSSSLQLSSPGIDLERTKQHKSKRTPVTAIKWNNEDSGRPLRTQSAWDLTNIGKSSQHSRVFDLYKYKNAPTVPVSSSNDFHEFSNINDITSTSSMNIAENRSTGYYKTDSPGQSPVVKYPTQSERYWEQGYKENSFKNNEMSNSPNDNLSISSDKETEAMELEREISVKVNIPVDRTLPSEIKTFHDPDPPEVSSSQTSEPENMDVDVPNVFLQSRNINSSTSVYIGPSTQHDSFPPKTERPGLTLTDHNRSLDAMKNFSSFMDFKSSKICDQENTLAYKTSGFFSNTTDDGGKFAWMNRRRGSNDNNAGFRSDTLKFQKRNASSLPDLIDQDSEILPNDADVTSFKNSLENVGEHATNVPETYSSSKVSNETNEVLTYEQPFVQKTIHQPKNLGSRTFQYLQTPYTSSYGSAIDGTFKNYPVVPYQEDRLTEKQSNNHTEGFMSETLKYKKRNTSSLPDFIYQDGEHGENNHNSAVLETNSSRIPDEKKEMYLDSCARYGQSCVQDTIQQPKTPSSRTSQSLQKLSTFSYGSELDRSSKKTIDSKVSYQTEIMTENNKVKNLLHLAETTPFSHVHSKFKSVQFNRSKYNGQHESDSNNNTKERTQTSFVLDDGSKIESVCIPPKQDHHETKLVKASKYETPSKPSLPVLYRQDVSLTNQNSGEDMQVEQGCELERNRNQNLIYQFDQEANNVIKSTKPPRVRDTRSQTLREHSEGINLSRATHLPTTEIKSTNLLKQHLLVAPEPFKRNVHISVIPKQDWKHSTSSEDGQNHQECENMTSIIVKNLPSENEVSQGGEFHKTYTCQRFVENTEIYESLTDSSYPEVDTIEYRKVVSIYYSLPRKFSKRVSDLSKNNLKNIDKTLEQNRAPSALLDRISRCHKEEHELYHQNSDKTPTSISETIQNKEVHSVDEAPSNTHLLNCQIIPLQTNLMKNSSRPNSGEEIISKSDDLVNKFGSLHISENEDDYTMEEPKNTNKYSPSRSSPRSVPTTYYCTLPNRKSNLQDLERNVLERDIAMARDRFNIYSSSKYATPSPPESQDVFTSPTFPYDNLNYSSGYDFMHFPEDNKEDYNINNVYDSGLYKKNSLDQGFISREDLPSMYKSKSLKDLSKRKSYNTENISPHMEYNTSPETDYNYPIFSKNNDVLNRTRPSYCSEFVQKKMKPINAKKFSFSFDHSGQEGVKPRRTGSYGDTVRISDGDSPSVCCSPNDNYPSRVNKHFNQESPVDCRSDVYSNLYRSKSMKILNTEGQEKFVDQKRKSEGSFSSKSYGGTLRTKSPSSGDSWNRRLSAEILDENDNWPISEETYERKPVCTSKSLDYGIFGKEQQEAILNNVKRSLTEGRLWRPSFLKNPGFLRTEEYCSSKETIPVGRSPDNDPSQEPSLNIYEDVPVVSSYSDTDTTTDDEYYLDENDKESEL